MARGRKKTPLATKRREGKRIRDETEIEPIPASLNCPDWVRPIGKKMWFRLAPELVRLGLVSILDEDGLALICNEFAIYRMAEEYLAEAGEFYQHPNGCPTKHPLVAVRDKAHANFTKLAAEYGFTPRSRSGVSVVSAGKEQEDELDEFLDEGNDDGVAGKIG
jgi:P27 family predicted phage terminase small subunit